MKVLLLGSGGRESALAWGLARSKVVSELVVAPGNPGVARIAEIIAANIEAPADVVAVAKAVSADLVVVGPEAPLVAGVGEALRADGRIVFGPDPVAARIEGSKAHAKDLMIRAGIPTGRSRVFTAMDPAIAYLDELGPPYVIKADGLAAGKGVAVTEDRGDALEALADRLERGRFGDAGRRVLVEEFLDGEEASLIAFVDGTNVVACEPAQDYKRVFDGDAGPNTGGMGSYSPVPACPPQLAEQIVADVLEPMVRATADSSAPFVGALYAGLALTSRGPRVIEFNARFGDPETQALVPRLRSDLGEVTIAAATGELEGMKLEWSPEACVSVVLASGGYPGPHETGHAITGIEAVESLDGVAVFHAGTALREGELVTAGGRVLAVSALGSTFGAARSLAYSAAAKIDFKGKHLRSDIGARAEDLERTP
ncbi:MAG: phosphoribosylamine--glycine ligase [Actinomycetota bacterium]